MSDHKESLIEELKEAMKSIDNIVKKYDMEDHCYMLNLVAIFDTDTINEGAMQMHCLWSADVDSKDQLEELTDLLMECYEAETEEEENDPSSIEYWIKRSGGNTSIN